MEKKKKKKDFHRDGNSRSAPTSITAYAPAPVIPRGGFSGAMKVRAADTYNHLGNRCETISARQEKIVGELAAALPRPRKIALSTLDSLESIAVLLHPRRSGWGSEKEDGNRDFRDGKPVLSSRFVSPLYLVRGRFLIVDRVADRRSSREKHR